MKNKKSIVYLCLCVFLFFLFQYFQTNLRRQECLAKEKIVSIHDAVLLLTLNRFSFMNNDVARDEGSNSVHVCSLIRLTRKGIVLRETQMILMDFGYFRKAEDSLFPFHQPKP